MLFITFEHRASGFVLTGSGATELAKANADAANWINTFSDRIVVRHIASGLTNALAGVTVWYDMREGFAPLPVAPHP